ncbi:MAG: HAD family hydrolase [Leuconostoc mesenteroides]
MAFPFSKGDNILQNIVFDFDGTLADSGDTGILATQTAFSSFQLRVPKAEVIDYFMGIPIEVSFKKMVPDHVFSEQEFQELLISFRSYYKRFEDEHLVLFPDVGSTLKSLYAQKKQLFVVSSKHSTALLRNLSHLGINHYFKGIVSSDQVSHFKPHPEGLLNLIDKFALDVGNTIMIGDATFDLKMGSAAGIKTGGVVWGAHDIELLRHENPDYIFRSPIEWLTI